MSYCLNPHCAQPHNPPQANFCAHCGQRLLLGDRYRSLEPIGQGGFGRTFLAVDEYKPSKPACVIKQFFPETQNQHTTQRARELFRREAVQLERLGTHPQIPDLLAHFEQDTYQYVVQEFIDGRNLCQALAQDGPFTAAQIGALLADLLPVLDYVHQQQVIHRDIKPQNIIRRQDPAQYVLVDFGAAKSLGGDPARTGTSIGSPEFTPPEQTIGRATFASDLYSLGVTCIFLLTQKRPSDLYDTGEGCWIWRQFLPEPVPEELGCILDKLLQGAMNRRYGSAQAVLHDLAAPALQVALGLTATATRQSAPALPARTPTAPGTVAAAAGSPPIARSPGPAPTALPASRTLEHWVCRHTLRGHQNWVRAVALHPHKPLVASGSGDKTVKIWDTRTGQLLHDVAAHNSWVRAIATSPAGDLLASGSNDRCIHLWYWEAGSKVQTLTGHTDWVRSLAFSPGGDWLLSGAQDKTLRLWHLATGGCRQVLTGHDHWVTTVAWLPRTPAGNAPGHWVISGSRDRTLRLWDWQRGQLLATFRGHKNSVNSVAVSPDGTVLVSSDDDGVIIVWDLARRIPQRTLTQHTGAVNSLAISADGVCLVSGSHDKTMRLWDVRTGEPLQVLNGHVGWIWSVALRSDQGAIASGSWDGTVKLWHREGDSASD